MIEFKVKGKYDKFMQFLEDIRRVVSRKDIDAIAQNCIHKLENATPKDTGLTAKSWDYEVERSRDKIKLIIYNTNVQNGTNIALLLEYGHATRNGGWIEGYDYIDPIIRETYMEILNQTWKDLTRR